MTQEGMDGQQEGAGGTEGQELVLANARGAECGDARPQRRRAMRGSWTGERRQAFLDALAETCNVLEACRAVGMTHTGAYKLRLRDAGFAAAWAKALEQGYSELEMLLLRQSIHGSTTTETVEDGAGQRKQVKTVHSYPHGVGLRLLLAHRAAAEAVRAQQVDAQVGSEQIRAEIQVKIAAMRARVVVDESQENGGTRA